MSELDPDALTRGTADAAFVVDRDGTIVSWNPAAERMLGFAADTVLGRPCHDVLCGLDPFGNRFCDQDCAVVRMIGRREPVHRFTLEVRVASGERIGVAVTVVHIPAREAGRGLTLHVLAPLGPGATTPLPPSPTTGPAIPPRAPSPAAERLRTLTPREVEVLRLLARGNASQDVANELTISLTTVRTHVQNILRKLEVHSQIEAVALAYRYGLI